MLKTIEGFAVECSINKVWTSEALAYAVDEAVQVFGGNGYSREFPAERAYRDARITRIYEGTNEINRLIIPTRLIKQAPGLFNATQAWKVLSDDQRPAADVGPLASEHALVASGKRLAIAALGYAADACGDTLKEEQEILGHVADVVIEVYAVESALARTEKLAGQRPERALVGADIARVYASDAGDRVAHSLKQVLAVLTARGVEAPGFEEATRRLAARPSADTITARRRIAADVIQAGRYTF